MPSGDILDGIEFDRSVIGMTVPVGSHEITEEEIVAYAKAMGETNPLYLDEEVAKAGPYGAIIAPPGFYHSIRLNQMPDIKLKFGDRNSGFIGGQSIEYFEPIRAGDTISAEAQVADVYAKTGRTGTLVFVVRRTTYSNQHGRTVMVVDGSTVRRETAK
ncbi:MAG: MaoC family dehydratase N-terminal domain-containing protein [Dehalococcoidia bacterium]|nr:MaoC family dehydratase N-terminal domain-containing protein [Dehalococcoidia bacterium]